MLTPTPNSISMHDSKERYLPNQYTLPGLQYYVTTLEE